MSTQQVKREKVPATSGDMLEQQIATLHGLFPQVFVEGTIDFDKLRATLGAAAESGPGRFSFATLSGVLLTS
jgi:adenine-specific DNA-methyltransferase